MMEIFGGILAFCGAAGIGTWWLQLRGAQRTKVAEMAYVPACRVANACSSARNPGADHDETVMAEYSPRLIMFNHAEEADLYPLVTILKAEDAAERLRDADVMIHKVFGPTAAEAVHRILHELAMTRMDALALAKKSHALGLAISQNQNSSELRETRNKERTTWLKDRGTPADQRLKELDEILMAALKGPLHFRGIYSKLPGRGSGYTKSQ